MSFSVTAAIIGACISAISGIFFYITRLKNQNALYKNREAVDKINEVVKKDINSKSLSELVDDANKRKSGRSGYSH